MKPTVSDKMEDFLTKANLLLTESKQTNCESKKTLKSINKKMNFFIASSLVIIVFMLGVVNDTRVEVVSKAEASEVVLKQNAKVVETLRIANQERNFALVVDTSCTMAIIKSNNENYIYTVEGIYDLKFRGGE